MFYKEGEAVEKDLKKAFELYTLAAHQGNKQSILVLNLYKLREGLTSSPSSKGDASFDKHNKDISQSSEGNKSNTESLLEKPLVLSTSLSESSTEMLKENPAPCDSILSNKNKEPDNFASEISLPVEEPIIDYFQTAANKKQLYLRLLTGIDLLIRNRHSSDPRDYFDSLINSDNSIITDNKPKREIEILAKFFYGFCLLKEDRMQNCSERSRAYTYFEEIKEECILARFYLSILMLQENDIQGAMAGLQLFL